MDQIVIRGGRRLNGSVRISGAKNAALPELCAALLTSEPVTLTNVPRLQDVGTTLSLLRSMGVVVEQGAADDGTVHLNAARLSDPVAPYELVKTMRASILVLGPLLARFGQARVSLPGGCAIGLRPVDQHIKGLQAMGAEVTTEHGDIVARVPGGVRGGRLHGARIRTDMVTVTGTENLLMAATLADGETVLENAAQEPEVVDLAAMLIAMGARIEGHGSSCIRVQGVPALAGVHHRIVPDRIETGTFLCAVAAAGGDVLLQGTVPGHLQAVIGALRAAGVTVDAGSDWLRVRSYRRPTAVGFETSEYPAFPTDMQAQFMALNCVAEGSAQIAETIFENRYMHVNELLRLGAHIEVDGNRATVHGVPRLSGARVMATDLRASASLVIAGLVAEGETIVDRIYHLDRGYERMEAKLGGLGADIARRPAAAP